MESRLEPVFQTAAGGLPNLAPRPEGNCDYHAPQPSAFATSACRVR